MWPTRTSVERPVSVDHSVGVLNRSATESLNPPTELVSWKWFDLNYNWTAFDTVPSNPQLQQPPNSDRCPGDLFPTGDQSGVRPGQTSGPLGWKRI